MEKTFKELSIGEIGVIDGARVKAMPYDKENGCAECAFFLDREQSPYMCRIADLFGDSPCENRYFKKIEE